MSVNYIVVKTIYGKDGQPKYYEVLYIRGPKKGQTEVIEAGD